MSGNIPLPSEGAKTGSRATATCYCSAVQLEFPTEGEDFVDSFICHCSDCRKITASMFASNFIVTDSSLKHVRGKELMTKYAQAKTIESGNIMENHFCSKCGTLLYRVSEGFPGKAIMRIGTIDDFDLHETKIKPRIEQYAKNRVKWCSAAEGVEQHEGGFYWAPVREQKK